MHILQRISVIYSEKAKWRFPSASISYAHCDRAIFLHRPILGVASCILSGVEIREIMYSAPVRWPYYLRTWCIGIWFDLSAGEAIKVKQKQGEWVGKKSEKAHIHGISAIRNFVLTLFCSLIEIQLHKNSRNFAKHFMVGNERVGGKRILTEGLLILLACWSEKVTHNTWNHKNWCSLPFLVYRVRCWLYKTINCCSSFGDFLPKLL